MTNFDILFSMIYTIINQVIPIVNENSTQIEDTSWSSRFLGN